MERKVSETLF